MIRRDAKFFDITDITSEDYVECKLSLLSKVVFETCCFLFILKFDAQVARSQCIEKSAYVLDLIMKARHQNHVNQHCQTQEDEKYFDTGFLQYVELTNQQRELLSLAEDLKKNTGDHNSPFQNFMKYSPDALNNLFDQCLMKPCDTQIQGETFFDFFLFKPDPGVDSEMDIFATLLTGRKERFLLHPLFDAFLKLKWQETSGIFYLHLCWVMIYLFVLVSYSLFKFSFSNSAFINYYFDYVMIVFFVYICFYSIIEFSIFVGWILSYLKHMQGIKCLLFTIFYSLKQLGWSMSHPILVGLFLFGNFDDMTSRSLCSVVIFMASVFSMQTLTQVPQIGMQSLMMTKVFFSVFTFFSSFGVIFFAFCVIFHILLPNSTSFGRLEDAVIKVLSMLMGELDFTNSFLLISKANFIAKTFFVLFLILMALVFMNLLLGLAVSDIGELERISRVRRAVVEYHTIVTNEKLLTILRYPIHS